ncbi:hypothetical protein [Breoghania sp.]|uniref:hypothetical protein n=1 Tax=Breoghania sp. TaxID=2065378 RepID=UPI00260A3BF6|nr:hypothetical protein [Breoghania sp.]MDJ0930566.1 hypothetical protein [Breoghania sp.]
MVKDLIRRGSASQYLLRISQTDQTVAGRHFAAGEKVLVHIPSANGVIPERNVGSDAETGCPAASGRRAKDHFSFGSGVHHCPGALLVRLLLGTAIDRLTAIYPEIELLGTDPEIHGTDIIKSPQSLRCRLNRKAGA